VYRYSPHFGEEPAISGTHGSGTVFFGRCTMRCLYCQNYLWSQNGAAAPCSVEELARVFRDLHDAGCHNWNLVSPTPWLPFIREVLAALKQDGVSLPIVYNTSGFERPSTLEAFADLADVFLVDLRYSRDGSAVEGSGAPGYVDMARSAILRMWSQTGPLELDSNGVAASGVLCRLLILPGRSGEAVENLRWLAATLGTGVAVSIMAQYLPAYRAGEGGVRHEWQRRINRSEYEEVCGEADRLGFDDGWVQDFDAQAPDDLIGYQMTPADAARS